MNTYREKLQEVLDGNSRYWQSYGVRWEAKIEETKVFTTMKEETPEECLQLKVLVECNGERIGVQTVRYAAETPHNIAWESFFMNFVRAGFAHMYEWGVSQRRTITSNYDKQVMCFPLTPKEIINYNKFKQEEDGVTSEEFSNREIESDSSNVNPDGDASDSVAFE